LSAGAERPEQEHDVFEKSESVRFNEGKCYCRSIGP